jgi:putative colanic acid biosynthesis UDP-glucose lipid carrier transferase
MRTRENELQFISVLLDLVLLNLSFIVVAILFPQQYFQDKPDVYSCFLIANFSWILLIDLRPSMGNHSDQYSTMIGSYSACHYVKPGITGWAQVNGYRGETDELWKMEKRVEYDKEYINNWSLDWDFVIVWKTIFALKAFVDIKWKEAS